MSLWEISESKPKSELKYKYRYNNLLILINNTERKWKEIIFTQNDNIKREAMF